MGLLLLLFISLNIGCAFCAIADWHKRTAVFMPVCFVTPDGSTTLPSYDKTYMFQHHDDQRYVIVLCGC